MKIGAIRDLNAQVLTFGFINSKEHQIIFDTPANLKNLLLEKKIDAALISSVECLRNSKTLSWCDKVGVCAYKEVQSILFFENKTKNNIIYTDIGSRSSVALLKILIQNMGSYTFIPKSPEYIIENIKQNKGNHLLFGDNALFIKYSKEYFQVKDLCKWWYEKTSLPFIFAFWAYCKSQKIDDSLFINSLKLGLENLDYILNRETKLEDSIKKNYLKQNLHFFVSELDKKGFNLFKKECEKLNLI